MADPKTLADFEEDEVEKAPVVQQPTQAPATLAVGLGTHSAVALGGFKDFCLKKELIRAIADNGFEHPSEVQHQAIPQATLGTDILAQAKSGMGKTAVFVFALLDQIEKPVAGEKKFVQALVVVHTHELAFQIEREFKRFNKYLPHCTTAVFFGGTLEEENVKILASVDNFPAIVVGTPGRLKALIQKRHLDASHVKWFVVDEFDQCLEDVRMRRDVQEIFMATPRTKQVMMFSATMSEEMRAVARKFMNTPQEIYVDQQSKLTLHGLAQYYMEVPEKDKVRHLCEIMDEVEFNQCIIFVSSVLRCKGLNQHLQMLKFPSMAIHSDMPQSERLAVYESCKSTKTRIVVSTDIFGRGIDIDRVNLVVQYDMAQKADTYLHRVGRAGRFGTKGVTVAFLTDEEHKFTAAGETHTHKDWDIMKEVQARFEMQVKQLTNPKEQLSHAQYMNQ